MINAVTIHINGKPKSLTFETAPNVYNCLERDINSEESQRIKFSLIAKALEFLEIPLDSDPEGSIALKQFNSRKEFNLFMGEHDTFEAS